ncbi:MAG: hypothetical protein K2O70_00415 [Desulfovibrionaceae bacterium]|nr:hypothetical protein [Desulfovibrionaceae bacterium]
MAGTVTSATSSLASELLLNKIMNGQVQTSTGQTITAAGRQLSAALSGQAYTARVAETNMEYGEGLVSAAQNEVSNLKDKLLQIKQNIIDIQNRDGASTTDIKSVLTSAKNAFAQATKLAINATYNNEKLLAGATKNLNAGATKIGVLGADMKVLGSMGTFKADTVFGNTVGSNKTAAATALSKVNATINALMNMEAAAQTQIKAVQNQKLILADQGANLDAAAAGQGVASMGGANNLLSAMLGGGTNV